MSEWSVFIYRLTRAENRCWDDAMTRYPSDLVHEIEVSFQRSWLVELPDEYRVLLSLRLKEQGVVDLGNGWVQLPREVAREAREALHAETGNWFIGRTAGFRTARARRAWEALVQNS